MLCFCSRFFAAAIPIFTVTAAHVTTVHAEPEWFARSSPWNTAISAADEVHPLSETWINQLLRTTRGIMQNTDVWAPVILRVTVDVPRVTLRMPGWEIRDFPMPPRLPSAIRYLERMGDTDLSFCIVESSTARVWNVWRLNLENSGSLTGGAGAVFSLEGSGQWANTTLPWSGRASGSSYCAGAVTPKDMESRSVRHALAVGIPKQLIRAMSHEGHSVPPAESSDGVGDRNSLPMGSRLQLDPALNIADLRRLGLTRENDIVIARALQTYGAFVVDSTAPDAFAIYYQSGLGFGVALYNVTGFWPRDVIKRLRVLRPPPRPKFDGRWTFNPSLVRYLPGQ